MIARDSLLSLEAYARERNAFRAKVIEHKKLRTLHVGGRWLYAQDGGERHGVSIFAARAGHVTRAGERGSLPGVTTRGRSERRLDRVTDPGGLGHAPPDPVPEPRASPSAGLHDHAVDDRRRGTRDGREEPPRAWTVLRCFAP